MDFAVFEELNKFNHIIFNEADHTYTNSLTGKKGVSGTKFISKFKNPFDSKLEAEKYAKKNNLNAEEVLAEWAKKGLISTIKGSAVHKYAELKYANKLHVYDPTEAINAFGEDIIKDNYEKCITQFENFYNDSKTSLIPVKSEVVVGDDEIGIYGMMDQLFYSKKLNGLVIEDYKTNGVIDKFSIYRKRMLSPISHLHECKLNIYSLQLNLYKFLIEKNTNLKIKGLFIIHMSETKENYEFIKIEDMRREIDLMINHYIKNK